MLDFIEQEKKAREILEDTPGVREENKRIMLVVAQRMMWLFCPLCHETAGFNETEALTVLEMMKLAVGVDYAEERGELINKPDSEKNVQ